MRSSHSLDRLDTAFDDDRLVADAGLLLPATLAQHLGLRALVDQHLDLGDKPGRANVGDKLLTLVLSALAGGDCIDDANALRAGGTARILGLASRPHPPWARTCAASAGAMCASSTGSAGNCSGGPGQPVPAPARLRSRSTWTRPSARPMASRRRAPCTTAARTCAAITHSSQSPRAAVWCSWRGCGKDVPTAPGAPPTSWSRPLAGSGMPEPGVS
jgi:hypothetical protein